MDTRGKRTVRRITLDISGFLESRLLEESEREGIKPGHVAKRILHKFYRGKTQ